MQRKTYLQHCLNNKGKLSRWLSNMMPLTFYIAPFRWYKSTSQADAYKYAGLVIDALNAWQNAAAGCIGFNVVNSLNDSQINLEWKRIDRKSLGQCQFHYDRRGDFIPPKFTSVFQTALFIRNIWTRPKFTIQFSMR